MPNIIKPAFVDEYVLVPQSGKCRRVRSRKYRLVAPKSNVDTALFDTRGQSSAHDFSSSFYWTPPLQSNRVFLRTLIQDKLHKVIYNFLKRNVIQGDSNRGFAKSNKICDGFCPLGPVWQRQSAAPCGHPIFGPPVDFEFRAGHLCCSSIPVAERLSAIRGSTKSERFAWCQRPPWRP